MIYDLLGPRVGVVTGTGINGEIVITNVDRWVIADAGGVGVVVAFAENDVHQGGDIGNGDVAVAVDVGNVVLALRGGVLGIAEDDVHEGGDIGNGDGTIVVDIAIGGGTDDLVGDVGCVEQRVAVGRAGIDGGCA